MTLCFDSPKNKNRKYKDLLILLVCFIIIIFYIILSSFKTFKFQVNKSFNIIYIKNVN